MQEGETVEALDQLITDAAELKRVTSEVRDLDVSDIDNALDYFEQVRLLNESGSHGIRTGLPGFDNYLPAGITPGQLGVLLAYPAIGKSWFVVYMAAQAWMHRDAHHSHYLNGDDRARGSQPLLHRARCRNVAAS